MEGQYLCSPSGSAEIPFNWPQSFHGLLSIVEKMMTRIERFLGEACDGCRLCRYSRDNPATMIGKIMAWHGKWCPAWKAWQQIERERRQEAKRRSNSEKASRKKR